LAESSNILLIEGSAGELAALALRLRALGHHVLRAKTPDEAAALLDERRHHVPVAVLSPSLPFHDLAGAIAGLRERSGGGLRFIATGRRPDAAVRDGLRAAGVEIALWEPFDDGVLRFQINQALREEGTSTRIQPRVATYLMARIWSGDRRKDGLLYSLSTSGAYLETPRPSPKGAGVQIDLPLPAGEVRVGGQVTFTNVPGNLARRNLGIGMGVRFTELRDEARRAIESFIARRLEALRV
jgi:hypothetical protein